MNKTKVIYDLLETLGPMTAWDLVAETGFARQNVNVALSNGCIAKYIAVVGVRHVHYQGAKVVNVYARTDKPYTYRDYSELKKSQAEIERAKQRDAARRAERRKEEIAAALADQYEERMGISDHQKEPIRSRTTRNGTRRITFGQGWTASHDAQRPTAASNGVSTLSWI